MGKNPLCQRAGCFAQECREHWGSMFRPQMRKFGKLQRSFLFEGVQRSRLSSQPSRIVCHVVSIVPRLQRHKVSAWVSWTSGHMGHINTHQTKIWVNQPPSVYRWSKISFHNQIYNYLFLSPRRTVVSDWCPKHSSWVARISGCSLMPRMKLCLQVVPLGGAILKRKPSLG